MKYALLSVSMALTSGLAGAEIGPIAGTWLTQDEDAKVHIHDCGDGTPCGTLVWVDPAAPGGGLDAKNPDAALRTRTLIGAEIIWGYNQKNKTWKNGRIYNPQDGKTFRSSLTLKSQDTLTVKGCLGPVCRSNTWTRSIPPKGES